MQRGGFVDRGFPRAFFVLEELTGELRQAERAAYEKLIRVMSHEVNNTVASSTSLLQSSLTYARELSPENRTDFETALGVVIARTAQLNTFMKGFADVFRLPAPARQPCELVAILERVVALISARPDAGGIAWRWELDAPAIRVSADPAQLEQAILNVVKNAVEAVDGTGDGHDPRHVEDDPPTLVVEDSGAGLTAEAQANLFTPFFSTKPGGQGIGLTLVGEILAGHGFDYALERTARGTTAFRITFTTTTAARRIPTTGSCTGLSHADAVISGQSTRKVTPAQVFVAAGAGHRRAERVELAGLGVGADLVGHPRVALEDQLELLHRLARSASPRGGCGPAGRSAGTGRA